MTRLGHAPPLPFSCGDLIVDARDVSSPSADSSRNAVNEAVQIETGEAVQIEAQAFAVMSVTQHHLSMRVGRGDYGEARNPADAPNPGVGASAHGDVVGVGVVG